LPRIFVNTDSFGPDDRAAQARILHLSWEHGQKRDAIDCDGDRQAPPFLKPRNRGYARQAKRMLRQLSV